MVNRVNFTIMTLLKEVCVSLLNSVIPAKVVFKDLLHRVSNLKSDNLQYNTLGRWVDRLIDQASDGPSLILID